MIDLEEAWRILDGASRPLGSEEVPLDAALGRVLAEGVAADRDFPPTDRSAMDGIAVRAADTRGAPVELRIVGEVAAGADPAAVRTGPGEACRIYTGSALPDGADAVVRVEDTAPVGPGRDRVRVEVSVEAGRHVRRRGEERRAGDPVLPFGAALRPAELAALAGLGRDPVRVVRTPRCAVLSTGAELVPTAATPRPHELRNSNGPMLRALVAEAGFRADDLGIAGDRLDALAGALREAAEFDVSFVTGGVSVGEYDLVAEALEAAGWETLFHGVRTKPGKPVLAARRPIPDDERGGSRFVLGLPGNPVSAFAGFLLFGAPLLHRLAGRATFAPHPVERRLTAPLRAAAGRTVFHLARASTDGRTVTPVATRGSGDVLSLAAADGFVRTPVEGADHAAGDPVPFYAWP